MRKEFLLLFFHFLFIGARAQYPGYTLLSKTDGFRTAFQEAAKKTNSIRSDFVQEKNLSLLADKITSKGKFWFERESKVRMEYLQPFNYLMILNAGRIYVKDGQKENRVSAGSSKVFTQVNRIMIDCVGGTILSNPDFSARIFEGPKGYLIELTPVAKNLRELYRSITIALDKKDYTASALDMTEVSGDNNLIRFTNKELNVPLAETLFAVN